MYKLTRPRRLLHLAAFLAALVAFGVGVGSAAAATNCNYPVILRQAFANKVPSTYPARCYKVAIQHETADLRTYAPWVDPDLRQAYHAALKTHVRNLAGLEQSPPISTRKQSNGPIANALSSFAPGDPAAVPTPIIVLGLLAGVLLLGGAGSVVVRRRHARLPRD